MKPGDPAARLSGLAGRLALLSASLEDEPAVRRAAESFRPETVIHAAWFGVGNCLRDDEGQLENVSVTVSLLRAARDAGAKTFIGLGSQAEYGPANHRLDETAPTRPTTLYGAAKLAACHLSHRLADLARIRWAWMRIFSTFGPDDNGDWMIPQLIAALLARQRPALTAGEQLWDYLYVEDAAAAIVAVAATPGASGVFNLGSGRAVPLRHLIERIRDRIDPSLPLGFGEVPYRPDQVMHLEADVQRLVKATGWGPQTSLEDGLDRTVKWYCEHARDRNE